jgi:hypothetical protein
LYSPTFDIDVDVKGQQWSGTRFSVNNNNALVLQMEDVCFIIDLALGIPIF